MDIPDQYVEWVATAWAATVTWLVTLERRLMARPTRKEQEIIAAAVASNIKDQFTSIKDMLEKQNDSAALNRQLVADSLAEVRTNVAVLRERVGDDPLGDVVSHRRRV